MARGLLESVETWAQRVCVIGVVFLDETCGTGESATQYNAFGKPVPKSDSCVDSQYIDTNLISKRLVKPRAVGVYLENLSFKNVILLQSCLTELGHILPRTRTGLSVRQHRKLVKEVKRARQLGLLPFSLYTR
ncbi:MAG: 30S ribosomal protein S18 [Candidatus Hodgkinia cicadicola]